MTASCPVCRGGRPADTLADLSVSWVTAPTRAPLPGYVCVVARTHVAEPFELPDGESEAFWADCLRVARAVQTVLRPRKLNYEIHGNTIEHLHLHLYPRYFGDPHEGGPIDWRSTEFARTPAELARIAAAIEAEPS